MKSNVFDFDVKQEVIKIRATIDKESISKISRVSIDPAVNLNSLKEIKYKVIEVKQLIRSYARYWGETEENIDEYIKE